MLICVELDGHKISFDPVLDRQPDAGLVSRFCGECPPVRSNIRCLQSCLLKTGSTFRCFQEREREMWEG